MKKAQQKVAAGKAGAIARKAKHERILSEFRTGKADMAPVADDTLPNEQAKPAPKLVVESSVGNVKTSNNTSVMALALIGGASFAGLVAYKWYSTPKQAVIPKIPHKGVTPTPPNCHLKFTKDPFYME